MTTKQSAEFYGNFKPASLASMYDHGKYNSPPYIYLRDLLYPGLSAVPAVLSRDERGTDVALLSVCSKLLKV